MARDRRTPAPTAHRITDCACNNLRKASRAVTRLFDDALRPAGLRATQFSVLQATAQLQPVTVTKLADVTVTERTTLTRNLALLERQGLIRIERGNDRRERKVTLVGPGRTALRRAYPHWQRAQAHVVEQLARGRWRALLEGLSAITRLATAGPSRWEPARRRTPAGARAPRPRRTAGP